MSKPLGESMKHFGRYIDLLTVPAEANFAIGFSGHIFFFKSDQEFEPDMKDCVHITKGDMCTDGIICDLEKLRYCQMASSKPTYDFRHADYDYSLAFYNKDISYFPNFEEYQNLRLLPDCTIAGTTRLMFTTAVVTGLNMTGYENRWCFENLGYALAALSDLQDVDYPLFDHEGLVANRAFSAQIVHGREK